VSERRLIVPVSPELMPDASRVIERALAGTRYLDGALDALRSATISPGADARVLASMIGEHLAGVIVFGFFGGASGAARLQLIAVESEARRAGVGAALVRDALTALRADGARFVLAELPDDSYALPGAREFLESLEFREESRVDDFYRDGLALSFMRLGLART
jgi:ribosomal protein S18 acetylase RimI-like enzyme